MTTSDVDTVISDAGRKHLRLQLTADVGPIRLQRLREHFGSLDAVLSASISEMQKVDGIGPCVAESILRSRSFDAVDREVERAKQRGLRIVCQEDPDYPQPLLKIPDPPICLYVRGRIEPSDCVAIAVVGTRRCSYYGREQAMRFGEMLSHAGFTVVSGLARGIDGHSHRGALKGGGRTIAVLGNGLGSIYPREHESLAEEIVGNGALLSELPVDAQPAPENFPRRNRIIIGLSLGVIVIEAGPRSGALITARLASEYNREVFAVPGRVDHPHQTEGVNALIRKGQAKLVTRLEDILDELGQVGEIMGRNDLPQPSSSGETPETKVSHAPPLAKLEAEEEMILEAISEGIEDPDAIVSATQLNAARVMSALTSLQLKGLVRQLPGNRFLRRRWGNDRDGAR